MDLGGVASLLGVPIAVAAVLVPLLAEGRPLRRLERVERVLADTQLIGARREVLEDARNDLAVMTAFSVVVPRLLWMLICGPLEIAWGAVSMFIGVGVPAGLDLAVITLDYSHTTFWTGAWNVVLGIGLLTWRHFFRRRLWNKHLGRKVPLP
jgi:hypothetical protein